MFSDRLLSIFEMMTARERSGVERGLLCAVATEITGVDAAAIALSSDELPLTRFCASDAMARSLIDLEMTVGEGPCSESIDGDMMVNEVDLTSNSSGRWMLYTPAALALGARATYGFPVRIGVIRLGVLSLYSATAGELSEDQTTDALLMASVVGRGIVALQAGAPPESLSHELQSEANFDFSVHQAAGMVAVQAAMSILVECEVAQQSTEFRSQQSDHHRASQGHDQPVRLVQHGRGLRATALACAQQ